MPVEPIRGSTLGLDLSPRFAQNSTVVGSPAAGSITSVCAITVPNFANIAVITGVILEGFVALTVGTNAVTCLVQIRQTGTAGAVVATSGALTCVATNLISVSVQGIDTAPLAAGVWIIAVTMGSGSATSTVSSTQLLATVV